MRHTEFFGHGSQREFGETMLEDVLHSGVEELGPAMLMAKRPTIDLALCDAHVMNSSSALRREPIAAQTFWWPMAAKLVSAGEDAEFPRRGDRT